MKASDVKQVLKRKNRRYLYHANSVITSLTFLRNGGLMSREIVEKSHLPQSPQITDDDDKKFHIYNDIFFDSMDLHKRFANLNHYGPVLFVYSIDVLDLLDDYEIQVTKNNPKNWPETIAEEDKYHRDAKDWESHFFEGDFGKHITVKNISEPIGFEHLKTILLDDPGSDEDRKKCFDEAVEAISAELVKIKQDGILKIRKCPPRCKCKESYQSKRLGYTKHRFSTTPFC